MFDKAKWEKLLKALEQKTQTVKGEKDGSDHLVKWGGVEQVIPIKDGAPVPVEALAADEVSGFELDFTISTADVDRDNDTINQAGWKLGAFEAAGGPVLFAHNRGEFPVGKATRTFVENAKLRSVARFPSRELHAVGNTAGRLALHGFGMKGASVGFMPGSFSFNEERGPFAIDFEDGHELLEWSVVPIPANPNAVQGAKSFGIDLAPVMEWATKWLDGEGGHVLVPRDLVEGVLSEAKGNPATVLVSKDGDAFAFKSGVNPPEPDGRPVDDTDEDQGDADTDPALDAEAGSADPDEKTCEMCDLGLKAVDGFHVVVRGNTDEARAFPCGKAATDPAPPAEPERLPDHHDPATGEPVLAKVETMIALALGARGGLGDEVADAQRTAVFNHGAEHLRSAFEREPPPFRAYTQGELRELFPDVFKLSDEELATVKGAPPPDDGDPADSGGVVSESGDGDDAPEMTVEEVERLADEAFSRAREQLIQATTGELADF